MAKNITVKIGDQLQNFQGVEFLKLQTVGSQGDTSFVDQDAVSVLPFTFKFDANGQHNEENIALYQKYKNCVERGLSVNTYINWEGALYPASSIPELNKIYAYTDIGPLDIIEITFGETVQNNIIEVIDTVFDEKKGNPASQQAIAEWVKKYVSKNGGGGAVTDEQIASAVEAYFEENPIEFTETDPTVPSWAKQKNKPSYTASEVGALPSTYTPPDQTAEQVGADAKGTADAKVSSHNTSNTSHNDIRLLIEGLTTRLNALADSTDTDLDQLSEIVAYIKSNKELIEGVTTNKVSVSDIINNLTTNVANKPLSAAQGVALKALIDAITVPTKVSAFDNDKGYITNTELGSVVDSALEEAKESGEFDGDRGFSILRVTTALSAYTTTTGGFTPKYRIALSTVLSESGASEVRIGDTILRNYYTYPVGYVDSSYVYVGAYASIRGSAGTSVTISNITESEVSGGENVVTFSDEKTLTIKNGRDGENGLPGDDGYTPVKGVDYDTPEDRAEIEAYIATELAKRGQLKPEYANSIEECTDTSKVYVLPDGYIYGYILTEVEVKPTYTNKLPLSTNSDGSLFVGTNGEKGYKTGYRLSSSGSEKAQTGCSFTGYIEAKAGDVIRIKNIASCVEGYHYIHGYSASFARVGSMTPAELVSGGTCSITLSSNIGDCKYIRISGGLLNENSIVTVNEEITEGGTTTGYAWANTGHAFVPADYEERILSLEEDVEDLKENGLETKSDLMFISPDGNDNNSGLTANTPKKTVKACVNAGAKRISAKRGVYNEIVQLWNVDELEILPTDNDLTYAVGEIRNPIVFDTSDSIAVSSFVAYNSIKRVAYSNSANTQFDKVFTKKSQPPVVSDYGSRYNSTIWLLSADEKTVCVKLKPVLTVAECEAEVNTFTYVSGYIYINATWINVAKVIVPTNWETGFYINKAEKIVLKEVEVRFAGSYNIDLRNCAYFDLYKCACKYTSYGSGFHPFNSNGVFTACYATKNYDGYGVSGYGHTTYIDCVSEFNFDDGVSHHNATEGTFIGGRYEGNGKGGNTPSYGAEVNIYGGLYKDNASFGIGYLYTTDKPANGMVQGAVMVGNPIGLSVNANCNVTAVSCVYKDNTTDKQFNGIVTEY